MSQTPSAAAREAARSREAARAGAMRQTRLLKKGLFAKDRTSLCFFQGEKPELTSSRSRETVVPMMYGFGDATPSPDTVSVMEELLVDHITEVVRSFRVPSSS